MSDSPVRFGLIGFGAWGRHHADSITRTRGAKLVAVAARSNESASAAREAYPDVAAYTDYRELLKRDDIDAIDIVLPSHLHFEVASAALESRRHVLLEKPMATTVEDCDRLIEIAKRKSRLLAIGHELRLSSLWGLVKTMIDDGFIGDPQYALVELSRKPYRPGADVQRGPGECLRHRQFAPAGAPGAAGQLQRDPEIQDGRLRGRLADAQRV
jgi:myo-inositol 2-dehydrogenase / D-chiro-inositol 1-dehydrogenase